MQGLIHHSDAILPGTSGPADWPTPYLVRQTRPLSNGANHPVNALARPFPASDIPVDHPEQQYLDLLRDIRDSGVQRGDRTGTGTLGVFGRQMRFDLSQGFPLLTTKRVHFHSILVELLWFLRGETNVRWLQERGVSIWDEWANDEGELGPVYGKQWRSWLAPDGHTIDQIAHAIEQLRRNPDSRRHVVSAWNPAEVE